KISETDAPTRVFADRPEHGERLRGDILFVDEQIEAERPIPEQRTRPQDACLLHDGAAGFNPLLLPGGAPPCPLHPDCPRPQARTRASEVSPLSTVFPGVTCARKRIQDGTAMEVLSSVQ